MSDLRSGIYTPRRAPACGLEELTRAASEVEGVRRGDVVPGDRVIVATRNSIYALTAEADGAFSVAGGWFDRRGESPARLGVAGCTAGGRALLSHLIAAPGLFLEFTNGLRTTRIARVRLVRG